MAVGSEMEPLARKSLKRRLVKPRLDSAPPAGVEGRGVTEGVSMGVEEVEGATGSWATWGFFAGLRRLAGGVAPEGGSLLFCCIVGGEEREFEDAEEEVPSLFRARGARG